MLLACGVAIAAWHPPADVPQVREKLAWFSAHADDYDTLFFGTSRIYREVMPAVFDQATAEAGEPAHAFNFGIDGMFPPEDGYVFDVLRARHPTRLRWVFVELSMFTTGFVDRDPDSIRAAYWHDWKRTKLISRAALSHRGKLVRWRKMIFGNADDRQHLAEALTHLRLFCVHALNSGAGEVLRERLTPPPTPARLQVVLGQAFDGFVGMPREKMDDAQLAEYQRRIEPRREHAALPRELSPDAQSNLDDILAGIRALGAQPILIESPVLADQRLVPRGSSDVPLLDFTDVRAWPDLFDPAHRSDYGHLNKVGAEIYSRALARRFVEIARARQSFR